jgi:hypothetical protein
LKVGNRDVVSLDPNPTARSESVSTSAAHLSQAAGEDTQRRHRDLGVGVAHMEDGFPAEKDFEPKSMQIFC